MAEKLFQLRAGAILTDQENGTTYNCHTVTDDFALGYIKLHPDSKILFSVLPENLDELLDKQPLNT